MAINWNNKISEDAAVGSMLSTKNNLVRLHKSVNQLGAELSEIKRLLQDIKQLLSSRVVSSNKKGDHLWNPLR